MSNLSLDGVLGLLRAAGEETRLRVLILLRRGELTVSELTHVLGQSQPRVSRHLKVLNDAGLVERYREGAWVFYRSTDAVGDDPLGGVIARLSDRLASSTDRLIQRDLERLQLARRARAATAAEYFSRNASQWDEIRTLHSPDAEIEKASREMLGDHVSDVLVDMGAGTGRMLIALADRYRRGVGYDLSTEMLAVARANLEREGVSHAQVRQGDMLAAPMDADAADLVTIHQVLHYLDDPGAAVAEAARVLRPGGRLLLVDFAPHELEFLRESHAHRRLGFTDEEVRTWGAAVGLDLVRTETLSPGRGEGDQLTVKLWLSAAPPAASAPRSPSNQQKAAL
ncbi:MAG: metalloregulator ArsR/SmtB family transcription factor [Pseudomonadota bacterium]